MKVKVRAFGDLVSTIGNEITIDLGEKATLKDLISVLAKKSNASKEGYIGHYEVAGQDLIILINGRNMKTLRGEVYLKNDDFVVILPPFIGG